MRGAEPVHPFVEVFDHPIFGPYTIHSPCVIALHSTTPSDRELLEALGLGHYQARAADWVPTREVAFSSVLDTAAWMARVGGWTVVVDDWRYTICGTLYGPRGAIDSGLAAARAWARFGTVFGFWIADSDDSYGFDLFEDGHRRRSRCALDEGFDEPLGRVLVRDEGPPLPGESPEPDPRSCSVIVWTIAKALGLTLDPHTTVFQTYEPSEPAVSS